jgi:serine protease Do
MRHRTYSPAWTIGVAFTVVLFLGESIGAVVHSAAQEQRDGIGLEARAHLSSFAPVVRSAAPAVVSISSEKIVKVPQIPEDSPVSEEFLRRHLSDDPSAQLGPVRERREHSGGSGVIVSRDGYVLTNHHMIEGAMEVKVTLSDDREFIGKVVGSDPGTDIAVLRINADRLPYIPFADSAKVQVGDVVLAIGNPFGLGRTVTMGIVGATGRGGLGIEDYEDFIQTDASINPGNSGGALTNAGGELIGINTAILSPSGVNLGIGFAIPSNLAHQVMDQIVKTGKVARGFMGALIQDLTPNLATALNISLKKGALVSDVDPDGPAGHAGLNSGDVIVELNSKPIKESRDIRLIVGVMHPGEEVSMSVQTNGQRKSVTFVLTEEPAVDVDVPASLALTEDTERDMGVRVHDLTPEIRSQLNLADTVNGILVTAIAQGSAAAEADLHPGDVIEQVNRKPILTGSEFLALTSQISPEPILLRVNRDGHGLFIAMK